MKQKALIAFLCSSILYIVGCNKKINTESEPANNPQISKPALQDMGYNYPILPGTPEWKALENHKQKLEVCQIPDNALLILSTKELVKVCLHYPLLDDIYAFNNINTGVSELIKNFNGIQELLKRKDALEELQKVYASALQKSDLLQNKIVSLEKGRYVLSLSTMEMLISRQELQGYQNNDVTKNIMKDLMEGYKLKMNNQDEFKGIGFLTNLISRGMIVSRRENLGIEESLTLEKLDGDLINVIDTKSNNMIK